MHIDVITSVRNEAYLLPFFLRHYAFADRILLMDDGSTDGSVDIARADPRVTLLPFPSTHGLDDGAIANAYKKVYRTHSRGRADWVLVPDVDEFLVHPDGMRRALSREPTPAFLRAMTGYHMITDTFPGPNLFDVRDGVNAGRAWRKPIIFTPDLDVRWGKGRHWGSGPCRRDGFDYTILHYRYLGLDWVLDRTVRNLTRANASSDANRAEIIGASFQATLDEHLRLTRLRFADAWLEKALVLPTPQSGSASPAWPSPAS